MGIYFRKCHVEILKKCHFGTSHRRVAYIYLRKNFTQMSFISDRDIVENVNEKRRHVSTL